MNPQGLYETTALIGVVKSLIRPKTFFLSRWFSQVLSFETKSVLFDVEIKRRRVAAFCSPYGKGRVVEEMGFRSKELAPSYINETKFMRPLRSMNRAMGETIGGGGGVPLTNLQRHMLRISTEAQELVEAVVRRKELMACEAAMEGTNTIQADGVPTAIVSFGRAPELRIHLAGDLRWSEGGADPQRDLSNWIELAHKTEGARISAIVMDPEAWSAASNNAAFLAKINNYNVTLNVQGAPLMVGPVAYADGPVYHGMWGSVEIWSYSDFYEDPITKEVRPFLPAGTVIGMSDSIAGRQLQGAILDEEAGLQSLEFFPNSWIERNPSGRMMQMQSAPLVAPLRPNSSFCASVL